MGEKIVVISESMEGKISKNPKSHAGIESSVTNDEGGVGVQTPFIGNKMRKKLQCLGGLNTRFDGFFLRLFKFVVYWVFLISSFFYKIGE